MSLVMSHESRSGQARQDPDHVTENGMQLNSPEFRNRTALRPFQQLQETSFAGVEEDEPYRIRF